MNSNNNDIPESARLYNERTRATSGFFKGMNPSITILATCIVCLFVALTLIFPDAARANIDNLRSWITYNFTWYYVVVAGAFLVFNGWLALGPHKHKKLGGKDTKPEFSYFSWFAMLYAAGQGIGLIFWSIAEPIMMLPGNPMAPVGGTAEAATSAMRITLFHWGIHAWSIYCIVGISLAYAAYRKGLPLTIRSTLYPLLGDRIYGPLGTVIDLLAICATIFGIATSLGLGTIQINAGLNYVFGTPMTTSVQLVLIAVISILAIFSVVSGVGRGIKLFSTVNFWLSIVLMAFFFLFGPTRYLIMLFLESTGDYVNNLFRLTFWTNAQAQDPAAWDGWQSSWQGWWTVFMWSWWLSWSAFTGTFIARISKGRTIQEFIFGVLLVPTLFTIVWVTLFGGTAISIELFGPGGITEAVSKDLSTAMYVTFEQMGVGSLAQFIGGVGAVLVATYFITSSDSGTLVLTTIMSNGNPQPPTPHRVTWGLFQGLLAGSLLAIGGTTALSSLQTLSIASALPFSIVMIMMCFSLAKALRDEDVAVASKRIEDADKKSSSNLQSATA